MTYEREGAGWLTAGQMRTQGAVALQAFQKCGGFELIGKDVSWTAVECFECPIQERNTLLLSSARFSPLVGKTDYLHTPEHIQLEQRGCCALVFDYLLSNICYSGSCFGRPSDQKAMVLLQNALMLWGRSDIKSSAVMKVQWTSIYSRFSIPGVTYLWIYLWNINLSCSWKLFLFAIFF